MLAEGAIGIKQTTFELEETSQHRKIPRRTSLCGFLLIVIVRVRVYDVNNRGRGSAATTSTFPTRLHNFRNQRCSCTRLFQQLTSASSPNLNNMQPPTFSAFKPRDYRISSAQSMTHVAWNCDGKKLAAVGIDKSTRIWSPEKSVGLFYFILFY